MKNSEYQAALDSIKCKEETSFVSDSGTCWPQLVFDANDPDIIALQKAINELALLKDIAEYRKPKKVLSQTEWGGTKYIVYHFCPACGCPVNGKSPIYTDERFCTSCGQALDWSEVKQ